MLPYVVIHNQISLDGSSSLNDFTFNPELFYGLAGCYEADIFLVGSNTAKTGVEIFLDSVPIEEKSDMVKPTLGPDDKRALWVIPDTRGVLQGLLHVYRRSEHCKDVLILVSKTTPQAYLDYLAAREFRYIEAGEDHVDLTRMMHIFAQQFQAKRVLTDSGGTLTSLLLEQGLVDEISIVIAPTLAGKNGVNLFQQLHTGEKPLQLQLLKSKTFESGEVHLVYKVLK